MPLVCPGFRFFPSGVDFDDIRDFRISDSNLAKLVCTTTGALELKCSYALDMFWRHFYNVQYNQLAYSRVGTCINSDLNPVFTAYNYGVEAFKQSWRNLSVVQYYRVINVSLSSVEFSNEKLHPPAHRTWNFRRSVNSFCNQHFFFGKVGTHFPNI